MEEIMKTLRSYLVLLLACAAVPAQSMQKEASAHAFTQEENATFIRIKNNAYQLGDLVLGMSKQTLASKTKEIRSFGTQEKFAAAAMALPNSLLNIKTALKTFCTAVDTYGKTPYGPQYVAALKAVTSSLRALKETFEKVENAQKIAAQAAQVINKRNGIVHAPAALQAVPVAIAADVARQSITPAKAPAQPAALDDNKKKSTALTPAKKAALAMSVLGTPLAIAGMMAAYDAGYVNPAALSVAANAVAASATSMFSSVWNSIRNLGTSTSNTVNAITPAPAAAAMNTASHAANTGANNLFNSFDVFTNHAK